MSKSIWRLRNMACHLTFRQPQPSCMPPATPPPPPSPCNCQQPFASCPTCPLASFLRLFRCGNTQLHLQLPQNKRCTLKTVRCLLHVARCTRRSLLAAHSRHRDCRSCDCIDQCTHSVRMERGRGGGVEGEWVNALSPLCDVQLANDQSGGCVAR